MEHSANGVWKKQLDGDLNGNYYAFQVKIDGKWLEETPGLVSFQISNHANGDTWNNIYVIYNARTTAVDYKLEGEWQLAVLGDTFYDSEEKIEQGSINVPPISMAIIFQE